MNDIEVAALTLYRDALRENQVSLEPIIGNYIFVYVPKMLMHHRTYWNEEHLFIFYDAGKNPDFGRDSIICSNNKETDLRRRLLYYPANLSNLEDELHEIMAGNIIMTKEEMPKKYLPKYHFINAEHFKIHNEMCPGLCNKY